MNAFSADNQANFACGIAVLDYITDSYELRLQALHHSMELGVVLGVKQSLLATPEEEIATEVNQILLSIGGIRTQIERSNGLRDEVRLMEWLGPDTTQPTKHIWVAQSTMRQDRVAMELAALRDSLSRKIQ